MRKLCMDAGSICAMVEITVSSSGDRALGTTGSGSGKMGASTASVDSASVD